MSTSTAQFDPALNRQRAEKIHMLGQPMHGTETALAAVEARLRALVRIDPDHRLSYLMSDSWGFNSEHIRQVNRVVDKFLDTVSRREIRRIAAQALSADKSPQAIVDQWFTEEQRNRLRRSLDDTEVPDRLMTACYAWLEALGTAQAARLLHLHRSRPRPDFDRFTQTPDPTPDKETSIGTISDRRPALIISNNALNRAFGVAIALPMSRTMPAEENRRQHVHVAASDSWASAWQIKSIDQARLSDPIGRASPRQASRPCGRRRYGDERRATQLNGPDPDDRYHPTGMTVGSRSMWQFGRVPNAPTGFHVFGGQYHAYHSSYSGNGQPCQECTLS